MIQRIQTVYLLLATILLTISAVYGLSCVIGSKDGVCGGWEVLSFGVLTLVAAIVSAITIFLFKNRLRQAKLARWSSLLILLAYLLVVISSYMTSSCFFAGNIMVFLPFVAAFFNIMARRAILKDEKMVRAADRIR